VYGDPEEGSELDVDTVDATDMVPTDMIAADDDTKPKPTAPENAASVSMDTVTAAFEIVLFGKASAKQASSEGRKSIRDSIGDDGFFKDTSHRLTISNPEWLPKLFSYIPKCEDVKLQRFILQSFLNLIKGRSSLVNLNACVMCNPKVLDLALDLFPTTNEVLHDALVEILQILGRYSISIAQMKHLFRMMQSAGEYRPAFNWRILQSLQGMIGKDNEDEDDEENGPKHSFVMDGFDSGIKLSPIGSWPARKAFSFSTWIRAESLSPDGCSDGNDMPYVVCLRSKRGQGFDMVLAPIRRSTLHRVMIRSYGREVSTALCDDPGMEVAVGQWQHIAFSVCAPVFGGKVDITIAVNGRTTTRSIFFPNMGEPIYDPMLGCCPEYLLTRKDAINTNFCGQMGAVYFFNDVLSQSKLRFIHDLGPGYFYTFEPDTIEYRDVREGISRKQNNCLSPTQGTTTAPLTSSILLAFNPGMYDDDNVYIDNTPIANRVEWRGVRFIPTHMRTLDYLGNYKIQAELLSGTHRSSKQNVQLALESLGGLKALLPLFTQLDQPRVVISSSGEEMIDTSPDMMLSKELFAFISKATIETSASSAEAAKRLATPLGLLDYFLTCISSKHLNVETFDKLTKIYDNLSWAPHLQESYFEHTLCNFKLLSRAPFVVQVQHLTWLKSMVAYKFDALKRILTVPKLLHDLSTYYTHGEHEPTSDDQHTSAHRGSDGVISKLSPDALLSSGKTFRLLSPQSSEPSAHTRNDDSLTSREVDLIRSAVMSMVKDSFQVSSERVIEDTQALCEYISAAPCIAYKIEGLKILSYTLSLHDISPLVVTGLSKRGCDGGSDAFLALMRYQNNQDPLLRFHIFNLFYTVLTRATDMEEEESCDNHDESPRSTKLSDCSKCTEEKNSSCGSKILAELTEEGYLHNDDDDLSIHSSSCSDDDALAQLAAVYAVSEKPCLLQTCTDTPLEDLNLNPASRGSFMMALLRSFVEVLDKSNDIASGGMEGSSRGGENHDEQVCSMDAQCEIIVCMLWTMLFGQSQESIMEAIDIHFSSGDTNSGSNTGVILQNTLNGTPENSTIVYAHTINALTYFIRQPIVPLEHKRCVLVKLVGMLRASEENCEMIQRIYWWQSGLLDIITDELLIGTSETHTHSDTQISPRVDILMSAINILKAICTRGDRKRSIQLFDVVVRLTQVLKKPAFQPYEEPTRSLIHIIADVFVTHAEVFHVKLQTMLKHAHAADDDVSASGMVATYSQVVKDRRRVNILEGYDEWANSIMEANRKESCSENDDGNGIKSVWAYAIKIMNDAMRNDLTPIDLSEPLWNKACKRIADTIVISINELHRQADDIMQMARAAHAELHDKFERTCNEIIHELDRYERRGKLKWESVVSNVANERGPWGYGGSSANVDLFWMLDSHETNNRRRLRLIRNDNGTHHDIASVLQRGGSNDKDEGSRAGSSDSERRKSLWDGKLKLELANSRTGPDDEEEGKFIHPHMYTCTHAHMHTCTQAHMHTCTQAHMHTCTHAHMHTVDM
jgi:hypothetical protein